MARKSLILCTIAVVAMLSAVLIATPSDGADDAIVISFNANGGTGAPEAITVLPGSSSYTIPSDVPERAGYAFMGWALTPGATSVDYYDGKIIPVTSSTQSTTYYAVWKSIPSDQPGYGATETVFTLIPILIALSLLIGGALYVMRRKGGLD